MSEKYVSPHRRPEGVENELLTVLSEEASEVIQHVCKAQRFGLEDGYPGSGVTNRASIAVELGELLALAEILQSRGTLNRKLLEKGRKEKYAKLNQYMQSGPVTS